MVSEVMNSNLDEVSEGVKISVNLRHYINFTETYSGTVLYIYLHAVEFFDDDSMQFLWKEEQVRIKFRKADKLHVRVFDSTAGHRTKILEVEYFLIFAALQQ